MSESEKKITEYTHAHKIQINYKSGKSVTMWFVKFDFKKRGSEITEIKWVLAHANTMIFSIGIDNIESVFRVDMKKFNHKEFGWNDEGQPTIT